MTEIIFLLTEEIALFSSVLGLIVIVVAVNYLLYEKYCAEAVEITSCCAVLGCVKKKNFSCFTRQTFDRCLPKRCFVRVTSFHPISERMSTVIKYIRFFKCSEHRSISTHNGLQIENSSQHSQFLIAVLAFFQSSTFKFNFEKPI